ncbi:hypothetical protein A9G22_07825 [Gilliamella sp. App2-1]|uniref:Abi family protein n=1 Tax=Gilliamella sp. App2-1 TaxID=3120230 RepID=UPI000828D74B|nr:Abi family protein [Gilliamella apicola]OCG22321.1 hypothetical protein A9G22_07825 [Gilliamella apicola]
MKITKKTIKCYKSYDQQLELLKKRGMVISDEEWAIKKLKQVGYYRLSGFWYRYRCPITFYLQQSPQYLILNPIRFPSIPKRKNIFTPNTTIEKINSLYLFDCELKILLFEGIARIENFMRSVIAHTIGEIDPLGYKNRSLIDTFYLNTNNGSKSKYDQWLDKLNNSIENSKDDCIRWHKENYQDIPIWAVTEIWDFGMLSKFYGMLKDTYKLGICQAIFNDKRLANSHKKNMQAALQHLNIIRNKCAHHARIWNISINSPKFNLKLVDELKIINPKDVSWEKIFGTICLMWMLIRLFSTNSEWLKKIINHIGRLPILVDDVNYSEMGFTYDHLDNLKKLI